MAPKFYTAEIHRCQYRKKHILVAPPNINKGVGLSNWTFKLLRNRKEKYTLVVCRRCNQTVAVVC